MGTDKTRSLKIDIREIQPSMRKESIFGLYRTLEPGSRLYVVADHDPAHLLPIMEKEWLPVVESEYDTIQVGEETFVGIFVKGEAAVGISHAGVKN